MIIDSVSESIDPTRFFPYFFGFGGGSSTGVGVLSLLFGAGYLAAAWYFDRRGLPASATPFQAVGIVAMLTALVVLHIFAARSRKGDTDAARHRALAIGATIALVLVLVGIPWPFLSYGRPLFRLP